MLADHPRRQLLAADQVVEVALRLLRQRQRRDLDAALAGVLDPRAPAAADLEHVVAGLDADRLERDVHLAGHRVVQRLVVAGEDALGVAAVPLVEEGQEEVGVFVVVVGDRLLVAA